MALKCVRGGFLRGANFFPNKCVETNISTKFDAFIRDANVCLIFDHNFPTIYTTEKLETRKTMK